MSSSVKAPEPFSFGASDLAAQWDLWKRQFPWYLVATRSGQNVDEEQQVGTLITLLGSEGLKIYDTFVFTVAADAKKIQPVLDKFTNHFEPRRNEVFERLKFLRRHQTSGETLDSWLIKLRGLVKTCNYGPSVDSVLRDQIVLGVADPLVRAKLLYERNLTLDKACEIVRACESSKAQLSQIATKSAPEAAHAIQSRPVDRKFEKRPESSSRAQYDRQPSTSQRSSQSGGAADGQQNPKCNKCCRHHRKNQCRVNNIRCFTCGVIGYVSSCCPTSSTPQQMAPRHSQNPAARVHTVEEETHWVGDVERGGTAMALPRSIGEDYFISQALTSTSSGGGSEWRQQVTVDGVNINFKLDSGATCNVLPYESFIRLPKTSQRLRPGPIVRSYRAQDGLLRVLGLHTAKVFHRGAVFVVDFVVVDEPGQPPLLGLPSCDELNLIRRVDTIQSPVETPLPPIVVDYMGIFTGLGKLPVEYDIKLLSGANRVDPVVCAASRLPFRLEDRVFKKLEEMVAKEILVPVHEPTEWVSRMMVVGKSDGDVRICLDPSELNKASILQSLPLNSCLASWIPLSEAASYLCTMATPKGRYRFLRLPFGLKLAPEIYLQTMSDLFGDLPGVLIYFDDFLVVGETKKELIANLRQVFEGCRLHDLWLQLKKFFLQEIPWLGHVIGYGTLKPDPLKVLAIVEMSDPTCPADLVRLLGMVTYLDKFCKNLAGLTRPLRDLLKEDAVWIWEQPQQIALSQLKRALSSLPVLRLFDHSLPLVVSVDASSIGIGAVLLQDNQPIAYSSTSLTDTQKRYFQIEKELLTVQFGLMRFRQYVYGQMVVVELDHKPLVGLLDKPIASCSPRIQRMRLQLQRFDFKLIYQPGKELFIADTLSRAPSPSLFNDDVTQNCEEQVHAVLDLIIPHDSTRVKFAEATAADPTLRLLMEVLRRGWPDHKSQCPVSVKPFWPVHHQLSEAGGLLLNGSRLVVPVALRQEVLAGIHDGHFGEVNCVLRAKSAVYWPECDDHIRNMVASCATCQTYRNRNLSQPLRPVPLPVHAFQLVSADLFLFNGASYVLVVDAYSKWPACVPLRTLSSSSVIAEVERIFSDFGVPEVVMSDNGSQYDCEEFRAYCKSRAIRSVFSSPTYAQSNGLVERHIQTVKKTMLEMFADGRSLWEALAVIRSTPISSELPSPAVLLQGRNLRGSLPFLKNRLVPQYVPAEFVRAQLQRRQASACFNHGGRPDIRGSALIVGQRVRAFVSGLWLAGAVEAVCSEPDSYVVRLMDGRALRRTRRDINLDNLPSAGFGVGQQSSGVAGPSSSVRGYRAPASASNLLPVLSWTPPTPPVLAVNRQAASSVPAALNQPSTAARNQVVRKPRTAKVWPASSRSSSRVAAQRQALSSEQTIRLVSPARPPDPVVQVAGQNLGAEPAAIQE
ncbi:uncharacterized protein LOC123475560 [Daphnia magna]|uniref:uncharacterized protein LOC123475560 n=1 Tax=Daphnia magna TaxID=35525 RepID=UPI001E1BBC55|nr:uncharacterized protein LOC123475560 [Daphnia magna]